MARVITKELAEKIASKLGADVVKSDGAHNIAFIYYNGVLIASFGIRRGSSKDLGHDHVTRDLHISPSQAKRLGQCPLSSDGYFAILREKGLLPAEEEATDETDDA